MSSNCRDNCFTSFFKLLSSADVDADTGVEVEVDVDDADVFRADVIPLCKFAGVLLTVEEEETRDDDDVVLAVDVEAEVGRADADTVLVGLVMGVAEAGFDFGVLATLALLDPDADMEVVEEKEKSL
jgi:hypothetical protein